MINMPWLGNKFHIQKSKISHIYISVKDFDKTCIRLYICIGVRYLRHCLLSWPRFMESMPSVRFFLKDSIPYLRKFWRKDGQLRTAKMTSANWDWTLHFSATGGENLHKNTLIIRIRIFTKYIIQSNSK